MFSSEIRLGSTHRRSLHEFQRFYHGHGTDRSVSGRFHSLSPNVNDPEIEAVFETKDHSFNDFHAWWIVSFYYSAELDNLD